MMNLLDRFINGVIDADWTDIYAVQVWVGVLLAVAWMNMMRDDPANARLPEWDLRLRRAGVLTMVAGFLLSVLFGGSQRWTPWPPMVLISFGFDFYLASAIFTTRHRARIRDDLIEMAAAARRRQVAAADPGTFP